MDLHHKVLYKSSTIGLGISVDVLYFHKAFDSVPHHHLLNKIYGYGIQGHLLLLFTLLVMD